jgi:hypothetical protein
MSPQRPAARVRADERPAGLGWLSVGAAMLFTVLLGVHVANKPGLSPQAGAPAQSIAQPAAATERSPS